MWARSPLTVVSGILTTIGFFATALIAAFKGNGKTWIIAGIVTIALAVVTIYLAIKRDAASEIRYFSRLSF
jgi:hypothetical protein